MKRFYLFLGLCALTANTSFAVQTTDSGTSRLGGIRTNKITDSSETKKTLLSIKEYKYTRTVRNYKSKDNNIWAFCKKCKFCKQCTYHCK